jgi:hypothetical protein
MADQRLSFAWLAVGHVFQLEDIGTATLVKADCFARYFLSGDCSLEGRNLVAGSRRLAGKKLFGRRFDD